MAEARHHHHRVRDDRDGRSAARTGNSRVARTAPLTNADGIARCWPGQTIVCIATGPSLTAADVDWCRDRARVIAINDAYRLAPWADALYACDAKWWRWHQGAPGFAGPKFGLRRNDDVFPVDVTVLDNTGEDGLESHPSGLRTGRNSGYQAINLAVLFGAARILLLGYDMARKDGKAHWFGNHPDHQDSPYHTFIEKFNAVAPVLHALGVEVLNCSRESALTCFPRVPLTEALPA